MQIKHYVVKINYISFLRAKYIKFHEPEEEVLSIIFPSVA